MQLPPSLRRAIDRELEGSNPARLRAASEQLTAAYRGDAIVTAITSDEQRAAYLAVRLPATFAAVVNALRWTRESITDEIHSVLDLGSGPGTGLWAAAEVFPDLQSATAIERDPKLISIGQRLVAEADLAALRQTQWTQGDITTALPEGSWDLVICSYALNELPTAKRAELMHAAWARARKILVVIEPGTKAGFANVLAVRSQLLAAGATLAAPCPDAYACPMAASSDWCHFAARVERTAEHRRAKGAALGHEDEKFSYVAFVKAEATRPAARIVRHPQIFSGYTQLTLCREAEIAQATVTRSHKENWRRLKRLGWGDRW